MFLTVVLFFYAAFFYKPPTSEEKIVKDQVTKSEDTQNILDIEEEKRLKREYAKAMFPKKRK